jgi:WD40 repeat protein
MDWENGILATGSWDSTVKLWQCSEANGYKIRLGVDEKAELEHSSQVTCLHLCTQHSQLVTGI